MTRESHIIPSAFGVHYNYWLTTQNTKGSGKEKCKTEWECNSARTGPFIKATGKMARKTEGGDWLKLILKCTRASGQTTNSMGVAGISMRMAAFTSDSGETTKKRDKEERNGRMVRFSQDTMLMDKRRDRDSSNGQMDLHTEDNLRIIIFMVKDYTNGQTIVHMMVIGSSIKCMATECMSGRTVNGTKENTLMTKSRERANSHGLTGASMTVVGTTVNNTGLENIFKQKAK